MDLVYHFSYQIMILLFMMLSFFFSGMETAIISASRFRLHVLAEKGSAGAKRGLVILDRVEDSVGMVLIGNNSVTVAAAAFITYLATRSLLLSETALLVITALQTLVFLILCEILPKIIARAWPESFMIFFSYPLILLMDVFRPMLRLSLFLSNKINAILKLKASGYALIGTRDDIGVMFKLGENEGIIKKDHQAFVAEILTFHEVMAADIMTPTIDMVSIEKKQSIKHLVHLIEKTKFSRIPVHEERVDNVVGYVYFGDLMKKKGAKRLEDLVRKPFFVPETKRIYELYKEIQKNKIPLVFVVNEFGAVEGMVTQEDIAEEIVGEIQTRDHPDKNLIEQLSPNRYRLMGNVDIDFIQRKFGITIDKKGFQTLAGFVNYRMNRIARKGDKFEYSGHQFLVDRATEKIVEYVILTLPAKKP